MNDLVLVAPFAAWAGPLSDIPDEAFGSGMLGEGIALDPLEGKVRAPCDAQVVAVAPTGHSVTLRHQNGMEILIHVGIDTVNLAGSGFIGTVAAGQMVSAGELLLEFDMDYIARHAKSVMTPLILLSDGARFSDVASGRIVQAGEPIGRARMASTATPTAPAPDQDGPAVSRTVRVPLANGLHARPSAKIGALLKPFLADVDIMVGDRSGNARSVTSLLKLNVRKDDEISIRARGQDAAQAVEALAALILTGLDEEEHHAPDAMDAPQTAGALTDGVGTGVRAARGGAIGVAVQLNGQDQPVPATGGTIAQERDALRSARSVLEGRLTALAGRSDIADAHLSLLDDPALLAQVDARIAAGVSAPAAWRAATQDEIAALKATGNRLLVERAADLLDVERQLIALMLGSEATDIRLPDNAIIIADELLPSDFLKLDLSRVAGILTAGGGPTSHVAILAGSNGIPMLVSCGPQLIDIADNVTILIDFDAPRFEVDPDVGRLASFETQAQQQRAREQAALDAAARDCFTADGQRIEIFANCGSATDAAAAARNGAEGCGLLRTEFLFLDRAVAPSVEEQRVHYADIAQALGSKPLIVRTLDAGSDKPLAYLPMPQEENPALGIRGIRVSLGTPRLLEEQFDAILQGVPAAQCRIMLPMVVDLSELREARRILRLSEDRLGIMQPTPLGIMVETPAAALLAEQLAREADFLSIGSNDLTQYALAADRQNPAVAATADALHPAVLSLVKMAAQGAHAHGRWLGVCGSIASDPDAAGLLIGLGVDELSVTPAMVPQIKAQVRSIDSTAARRLADRALSLATAQQVRQLIKEADHAYAL